MSPVERLLREAPSPTVTDPAALSCVAAILRAEKASAPTEAGALNADLPTGADQREVASGNSVPRILAIARIWSRRRHADHADAFTPRLGTGGFTHTTG
jgi:hypothetical protein